MSGHDPRAILMRVLDSIDDAIDAGHTVDDMVVLLVVNGDDESTHVTHGLSVDVGRRYGTLAYFLRSHEKHLDDEHFGGDE